MLFKNTQLFVRNLHRWDDLYVLFVRSSSVVCIERRFLEVWYSRTTLVTVSRVSTKTLGSVSSQHVFKIKR